MSDIRNNKGSISGKITSAGSVSGGIVKPKSNVQGGAVSRNLSGTKDYERLSNLPQINGEELIGNKTSDDLHIKQEYTYSEVGAVGAENQIEMQEIDRLFNAVFGTGLD